MFAKKILLLTALLISTAFVFAQVSEIKSTSNLENEPEWIQMMYQNNADPELVEQAYEIYYQNHKLVKNIHTQYYKRWQRAMQRDVNGWFASGGTMTPAEVHALEADYLAKTAALQMQRGPSSAWEGVGPYDFDKESVSRSYASGSAHVYTVEQSISNTNILYAGTATAGVYKSVDKGLNWTLMTKGMIINGFRSIEIDYTNPNIVYFEAGGVLYKTTDGGVNWLVIGDATFQATSHEVRDIVMHPSNAQSIYLCAKDGLYHTTDGGANWTQLLSGYFQELEFKPGDASVIYTVKQPGVQTEFYKSTDGGATWVLKPTGWPSVAGADEQKRVEIAVSADEPNYVFALATGKANGGSGLFGVYKSTDSGETWAFVCCGPQPAGVPSVTNPNLMGWSDAGTDDGGQYYYDLAFAVDPNDADKIHVGGVNHWVSTDGGATFTCPSKWSHVDKINYVHADIHDIHYYGNDLWFGCDGGVFYSNDGGATINRRQFGIAGTDFWGFGIGHSDAEVMLGGTYHNGTLLKDHNVYTNGWVCTGGGDNYRGFVNPGDSRLVYFDYGEKRLSGDRTIGYEGLSLNLQPNATYTVGKSSNIEFLPSNYHSFYLGNGTAIWKTTDDGLTFTQVHDFGAKVAEIRLVGSNPNVIYCTTYDANKVWKSVDAGASWTEISPNGTYRRYDIAVSNTDANKIWAIRLSNTGSTRVYYSSNGGNSWTNITGSNMSGETLTNIVCQQGTNGGVYIGTKRAVYYKNLSMGDFALFNNGLPASTYSVRLIPNYETGKLFNGTNRSAYKVDMYESSAPIAQISVDKNELFCAGEQAQFASVSVASASASYSWSFAGGSPTTSSSKTPLIQYNNPGTYNVSLSVSDANGSDSQTISGLITVGNECDPEIVPGNAMICGVSGDYATIPDLGLTTNTITFSAWVKPNGTQPDYSGIVFNDGTSAGLNFREGKLAYHWPGGAYWWNSNLVIPEDVWSHVAMVVTPTGVTLYLNGVGSTHNFTAGTVSFGTMKAGSYKGWGSRNFKGEMDEICIYNRSLSADEIKDLMHLTKIPVNDASLIHYYQFNRMSGTVTDRSGNLLHAAFTGGATRATSTAPVGGGISHRMTVNSSGAKVFTGTDLTLEFPVGATYPDGDLVVSRIDVAPDQTPGALPTPANRYWVINNYGNNLTFTPLTSLKFEGLSGITTANGGSEYKLHKRSSSADGSTWSNELDYADAATSTSLLFSTDNGISSFSQFTINKAAAVLPVELLNFTVRRTVDNSAIIEWNTGAEIRNSHFELERSKDGVNFLFFAKIISKGNTNEGNSYTTEDENPYNGLTYYRLKQVDIDGSFTYAPIRSIVINALPENIIVYPNPLTDNRILKVQSVFQENLTLDLFDARGKQIKSEIIPQGNGEIDLKALPQGTYFYRVTSGTFMKNGAIILD